MNKTDFALLNSELNKDSKAYWFFSSILNSSQNDTLLNLVKVVFSQKDDLNEPIYIVEEGRGINYAKHICLTKKTSVSLLNDVVFDTAFDWGSKSSIEMLKYFNQIGMNFDSKDVEYTIPSEYEDELKLAINSGNIEEFLCQFESTKTLKDTLFIIKPGHPPTRRIVEILKIVRETIGDEEFNKRVELNSLLHKAILRDLSIVVDYLVNEANVNINTKDQEGHTPVMLCKSSGVLNSLLKRDDLSLFEKDNKGKDVFYYYGIMSDKDQSRVMLPALQTYAKKNISVEESSDSLVEANKKTLMALIVSDKNKKEIESFIKQNSMSDFNDIFDSKQRGMHQLSLMKDNWVKYNIVKKGYSKDYRDGTGYGVVEYVLAKTSVKNQARALPVVSEILEDLPKDAGFNMLRRFMRLNRAFSVPKWYIGDNMSNFLDAFTGKDYREENMQSFRVNVMGKTHFGSSYAYSPDGLEVLKENTRPYFLHALNNGFAEKINELDLIKMCTTTNKYSDTVQNFETSMTIVNNLMVIKELATEYNINLDKLVVRVDELATDYIKDAWSQLKDRVNSRGEPVLYERNRFAQDVVQLSDFLIDFGTKRLSDVLTEDLLKLMKQQEKDKFSKIDAYLLSTSLNSRQENIVRKISKI